MKKAVVVGILAGLPLLGGASARAQDASDDYDAHFGWREEEETAPAPEGPHSLAEAKQQHRGYRLGQSDNLHAVGGTDVHVVQPGDTLWDISDRYFGDPWHWPELWSFNPEITNPHWIYPLDQIRLTPNALATDAEVARVKAGGAPANLKEQGASAGVLAGTETAPSVVVPRELMQPGTVFLRDQGYLDPDALRTAGQITGGNEEQMFLGPSDQVYVRFKTDQDVRAGQSYTIFRAIKPDERSEGEQGTLVRILGTVAVRSYDRNTHVARGLITEAMEPIERGMFVAYMDRRFDLVAAKRNQNNVVAHIIADTQPHVLVAYGDVVFLDVGEGHGIQPGNRFFVVRRGDAWLESIGADPTDVGNIVEVPEYQKQELPKEVVAELRVLKVRKNTTVALVIRSDTDLLMGDRAEMRVGF